VEKVESGAEKFLCAATLRAPASCDEVARPAGRGHSHRDVHGVL